jgi:hypothetical protein
MRRATFAVVAISAVVLASAITVVSAANSRGTGDCSQYEGHARERCQNAQADQRAARIRAHCAENPDDQVCKPARGEVSPERMRAYCREHPDDSRCQGR